MLGETTSHGNDLKDTNSQVSLPSSEEALTLSYNKTNKLITALYMVTDIMDKEEPLRKKLRDLGVEVLSDIRKLSYRTSATHFKVDALISEILSFLGIASDIGLISEMNAGILKKEFLALRKSVQESTPKLVNNNPRWLEGLLEEEREEEEGGSLIAFMNRGFAVTGPKNYPLKGQLGTRIGVQKGSTLLKALSDKVPDLSRTKAAPKNHSGEAFRNDRREDIVSIIKDKAKKVINFDGASIKDIAVALKDMGKETGEKTIQRELVTLVHDGVLLKIGSKRWSKYKIM